MALEMICGLCRGTLLVEHFGVVVECPHCGGHLKIPAPKPKAEGSAGSTSQRPKSPAPGASPSSQKPQQKSVPQPSAQRPPSKPAPQPAATTRPKPPTPTSSQPVAQRRAPSPPPPAKDFNPLSFLESDVPSESSAPAAAVNDNPLAFLESPEPAQPTAPKPSKPKPTPSTKPPQPASASSRPVESKPKRPDVPAQKPAAPQSLPTPPRKPDVAAPSVSKPTKPATPPPSPPPVPVKAASSPAAEAPSFPLFGDDDSTAAPSSTGKAAPAETPVPMPTDPDAPPDFANLFGQSEPEPPKSKAAVESEPQPFAVDFGVAAAEPESEPVVPEPKTTSKAAEEESDSVLDSAPSDTATPSQIFGSLFSEPSAPVETFAPPSPPPGRMPIAEEPPPALQPAPETSETPATSDSAINSLANLFGAEAGTESAKPPISPEVQPTAVIPEREADQATPIVDDEFAPIEPEPFPFVAEDSPSPEAPVKVSEAVAEMLPQQESAAPDFLDFLAGEPQPQPASGNADSDSTDTLKADVATEEFLLKSDPQFVVPDSVSEEEIESDVPQMFTDVDEPAGGMDHPQLTADSDEPTIAGSSSKPAGATASDLAPPALPFDSIAAAQSPSEDSVAQLEPDSVEAETGADSLPFGDAGAFSFDWPEQPNETPATPPDARQEPADSLAETEAFSLGSESLREQVPDDATTPDVETLSEPADVLAMTDQSTAKIDAEITSEEDLIPDESLAPTMEFKAIPDEPSDEFAADDQPMLEDEAAEDEAAEEEDADVEASEEVKVSPKKEADGFVWISKGKLTVLLAYAVAITLGFVLVLVRFIQAGGASGGSGGGGDGLENLPDIAPIKNSKQVFIVPYEAEMIAGHQLKVGDSQRFGNIKVTVQKVTRGPMTFTHISKAPGKTRLPSSEVLKLWLKFENVSKDQEIAPLDTWLMFSRTGKSRLDWRGNQTVCRSADKPKKRGKRVLAYDHPFKDEWDITGLPLGKKLKPGESCVMFVPTSENDLEGLTGDLVWRVHIRKGYGPKGNGVTTIFEVQFASNVIANEGTS